MDRIIITSRPAPKNTQEIKPSEAQAGDVLCNWPTTNPTIRSVETWPDDGFVKIAFADGGVLNTYDTKPIVVVRKTA